MSRIMAVLGFMSLPVGAVLLGCWGCAWDEVVREWRQGRRTCRRHESPQRKPDSEVKP